MSRKYVVKTRIEAVMLIVMDLGWEFFWTGEFTPKTLGILAGSSPWTVLLKVAQS